MSCCNDLMKHLHRETDTPDNYYNYDYYYITDRKYYYNYYRQREVEVADVLL